MKLELKKSTVPTAMLLQMKGRKSFLVELHKFSKSLKAYHIIKIKLKPLSSTFGQVKRRKNIFDGNELHDVKIKV